mmetsp:Transcript_76829/g.201578  ORF Transcript_76829/g.201578 Transcript_76829/m.201578 type:complete len:423 (-) Transcript_76829:879-2147(-)
MLGLCLVLRLVRPLRGVLIRLGAFVELTSNEAVQEAQAFVHVDVLTRRVVWQDLCHQVGRISQLLELVAALLQVGDARGPVVLDDGVDACAPDPRLRHQLHEGTHEVAPRAGILERPVHGLAEEVDDVVDRVAVDRGEPCVLAQHPRNDLHQDVRERGLLEELQIRVHGKRPEGRVRILVLSRALRDKRHQVVGRLARNQVAAQLEDRVHRVHVPLVVRGEALRERCHALDQLAPKVCVDARAEVEGELLHHDDDVLGVRHPEQQVQRLALQRLVGVLQAVHNNHLVFIGVGRVHLHNLRQPRDAEVLEVVILARDEPRDVGRGKLEEGVVRVNAGDALHALVDDGVAHVHAAVRAAHALLEDLVHLLRGLLVRGAQDAENRQELHLQPWGGHPVVVKISGQPMLCDLLQDAHEGGDEVLAT